MCKRKKERKKQVDYYSVLFKSGSEMLLGSLFNVNYCRFERIAEVVPNLDVEGKLKRILARFHQELEKVTRMYNKQCENPPQLRGLPPVAGKSVNRNVYKLLHFIIIFSFTMSILFLIQLHGPFCH